MNSKYVNISDTLTCIIYYKYGSLQMMTISKRNIYNTRRYFWLMEVRDME